MESGDLLTFHRPVDPILAPYAAALRKRLASTYTTRAAVRPIVRLAIATTSPRTSPSSAVRVWVSSSTTTPGTTTTPSTESSTLEAEEEAASTKYTEESVLPTGGGGKVGLLIISPLVLAGSVEETEYANHFTLLKTVETMFGVEPLGYAAEEEVPTLSPELFVKEETEEERAAKESAAEEAEGA